MMGMKKLLSQHSILKTIGIVILSISITACLPEASGTKLKKIAGAQVYKDNQKGCGEKYFVASLGDQCAESCSDVENTHEGTKEEVDDMAIYRIIKSIYEENVFELYGDGTQSRDFTYVEDVAAGNLKALKQVGFEIFNIGGGNNPVSIKEIINYIETKLGKKINLGSYEFHSADVKATCANIDKAKNYLNWEPVTSLHAGLNKTIDWYLENRDFAKKI